MIELITGLPGNSKTLYTIGYVKEWAERENRPVFYSGIAELTLDWKEIDAEKWMDVPPKSIVVIDECQRIFRNRSLGTVPGKHVTDLETHRHLGIDLVFVSQHTNLIDPHIRRLAGRHRHMIRIFGMQWSTVHMWDSVRENADKSSARKDSIKTRYVFDKKLFGVYKSAEEHTMKRSIPLRVKLLFLLPLVLAGAAYAVWWFMFGKHKLPVVPPGKAVALVTGTTGEVGGPAGAALTKIPVAKFDPVEDLKRYVQMNTPRVEGLALTSPKYDELTKPSRVPVPSMCIKVADRCQCYSQQGTSLDVKMTMCLGFVSTGYFQEFDPDRDRVESRKAVESTKVLEGRGTQMASVVQSERAVGGQVAMFGVPAPEAPHMPAVGK